MHHEAPLSQKFSVHRMHNIARNCRKLWLCILQAMQSSYGTCNCRNGLETRHLSKLLPSSWTQNCSPGIGAPTRLMIWDFLGRGRP